MPPLATWETPARIAGVLAGLEEATAVRHPEHAGEAEASEAIRDERCDEYERDEACLRQVRHLLPFPRSGRPAEPRRPSGTARPPFRDPPVELPGRRVLPTLTRGGFLSRARRNSSRRRRTPSP